MITSSWGILAPEPVASERRTRTLGLGAAVRTFNDLAVPGMGGVWFGKQLFLATLGVAVCAQARRRNARLDNIKVANAIEALACWMSYQKSGGVRDDRLRGIQKLGNVSDEPMFSTFAQPGFYVSQPMRMATVQAVKALGLVHSGGERFNSYSCTNAGMDFIRTVIGANRPHKRDALDVLADWACGEGKTVNTNSMRIILSPELPLQENAINCVRERIVRGDDNDSARRRAALNWVGSLVGKSGSDVDGKPSALSDEHWHDVQAGTLFFAMQAQAYKVLDAVEVVLATGQGDPLDLTSAIVPAVGQAVAALRVSAQRYLAHDFQDLADTGANVFARACAKANDQHVVKELLERDGRVLRLRDGVVVPGQAFDYGRRADGVDLEDPDTPAAPESTGDFPLPEGASYRLRNLYLLNLDLTSQLDGWLGITMSSPRTRND